MNYPLASSSWGNEELEALKSVMDTNMYSMGACVRQFEDKFASFFGSKHCVMVNSGSSANLLAVAALFYRKENPLKAGDEVIVPAVSWSTTYYPLYQYGLKIKFVDIDINTLNMDLDALESAITNKTKLIFSVNLLGNPNDYNKVNEIIKDKNITILEDNCESMSSKYDNKYSGTFGIMGTFSSFFSHHMSTMEGGMIITDDEELYHILLSIRSHGWTRHLPKKNRVTGTKSDDPFKESFKFVLPGYNVRPLELCGAVGLKQLEKLPQMIDMRRKNAEYFLKLFSGDDRIIIQKETGMSSWFGFSLVVKEGRGFNRDKLVDKLESKGIDVRPIVAGNFVRNDVVKYFDYEIHGELKNSDYVDDNGFFVGNHHYDITKCLDYLKDSML